MARTALVILNQPSLDAPAHTVGAPALQPVDPASAQLSVLDLAATRGDGVFETIGVVNGHARAVRAHLERFARSAAALDLPAPHAEAWLAATSAAIGSIDPTEEATAKLVLTRGVEGDGRPTGWVFAAPAPDHTVARTTGVRVVTLDRGYAYNANQTAPWLLIGAKTLSYAVNAAALREARRRDADDVIFVSSEGFLTEGPTSSLIVRVGDRLTTPQTGPSLDGTTQGDIFQWALQQGMRTGFDLIGVDDLLQADAAWLVSSGRHAAPIRQVNGTDLPVDSALTAGINSYLRERGDDA